MRAARVDAFPTGALATVVLGMALFVLILLALSPMDSTAQLLIAAFFLTVMWYCRSLNAAEEPGGLPRVMIIIVLLSVWAAGILFGAVFYSLVIGLLGATTNVLPFERRRLTIADLPAGTSLPSVDVMIPSYNEEASLLETTLRAAVILRYPANLLRVHLLDDGGTDQRLTTRTRRRQRPPCIADRNCRRFAPGSASTTTRAPGTNTPRPVTSITH